MTATCIHCGTELKCATGETAPECGDGKCAKRITTQFPCATCRKAKSCDRWPRDTCEEHES